MRKKGDRAHSKAMMRLLEKVRLGEIKRDPYYHIFEIDGVNMVFTGDMIPTGYGEGLERFLGMI